MFENLTEENVLLFAMKYYDNPNMIISEFDEDIKRFYYLKRLFYRYRKYNEIRERLVLNHLVVLYNVFGAETSTRLLFYFIESEHYSILKTYLVFLNYMPTIVKGIRGKDLLSSDIMIEENIVKVLRNIK
jgi:hypothetical protein